MESITTPETLTSEIERGRDAIAGWPSNVGSAHFAQVAGEQSIAELAAELAERNAARSKL